MICNTNRQPYPTPSSKKKESPPQQNFVSQTTPLLPKRGLERAHPLLCFATLLLFYSLISCYTFKSTGIPPNVNTFFVEEFDNTSRNIVPTLSYDFTQALIEKILRESRLNFVETDPDIVYSGTITRYDVTSVAPTEQDGLPTAAFNRLDIAVRVDYVNNKEEDEKKREWSQQFSFFVDYESTTNLLDIQDELIVQINEQLVEDIFNRTFSDW